MKVYHYTSKTGLSTITTSSEFHPSYLNPEMDTAFGEGWYFTDLSPDTTPNDDLQMSLWMRTGQTERTKCECYLAFEIDDELLQYCRPNVYRLALDTIENHIIDITLTYSYDERGKKEAIRFVNSGIKKII